MLHEKPAKIHQNHQNFAQFSHSMKIEKFLHRLSAIWMWSHRILAEKSIFENLFEWFLFMFRPDNNELSKCVLCIGVYIQTNCVRWHCCEQRVYECMYICRGYIQRSVKSKTKREDDEIRCLGQYFWYRCLSTQVALITFHRYEREIRSHTHNAMSDVRWQTEIQYIQMGWIPPIWWSRHYTCGSAQSAVRVFQLISTSTFDDALECFLFLFFSFCLSFLCCCLVLYFLINCLFGPSIAIGFSRVFTANDEHDPVLCHKMSNNWSLVRIGDALSLMQKVYVGFRLNDYNEYKCLTSIDTDWRKIAH